MKDRKLHVTTRNDYGTRQVYRLQSRRISQGGRTYLGRINEDWCQDDKGHMVFGYYWTDLAGDPGKTVPLLRECLADFERELASRRAANDARSACSSIG